MSRITAQSNMEVRKRHTSNVGSQEPSPSSPPPPSKETLEEKEKKEKEKMDTESSGGHAQWLVFAVASGACAAFNGVFAKLTTTELTTRLSSTIAGVLGISTHEKAVELVVRVFFFVLNLTFNGIMWSLFTTALARGRSATQVSIMNTSTNFLVTAIMGMIIFSEALPPMWWAGASLLVVGSVIAGRKDEGDKEAAAVAEEGYAPVPNEEPQEDVAGKDYQDEDVPDLGSP